jgi:predicted small lipoprotein YifL
MFLAAGLALALAACGSAGNETPPDDRVAAAAWHEWKRYGGNILDYGGSSSRNGGGHESRDPLASRIGTYWRAAGHREWDGRSDKPWSGAFVAWVVKDAGINGRDFRAAGRHAEYMKSMLDLQLAGRPGRYVVSDWRDVSPKSGDLVCASARAAGHRDASALRAAVDREVTHCDVVIDNRNGRLRVVGGNVSDSVSMSFFPTDFSGRLLPVRGRPWFAVVDKRD